MPLSTQTQELFNRVFGRGAESSEERSFLKDLEARKGSGSAATFGGIQYAKQQGRFGGGSGGGSSQGEIDSSEQLAGNLENAYKLMQKKAKQLDDKQKKLFTQDLKLQLKQELASSPEYKALQEKKGDLSKRFQTETFGPQDSELLDPTFVDRLALQERGDFAQSISNLTEDIRTRDSGIGSFLDRLEASRQQEYDTAKDQFGVAQDLFNTGLDYEQNTRDEKQFELDRQKTLSEIALNEAKARAEEKGLGGDVVPGDPTTLSREAQLVLRNPTLFSEAGFMTPSKKEEVLAELGAYGINDQQLAELTYESIPNAARDSISQLDGGLRRVQEALDALNAGTFGTGPIQTRKNNIASNVFGVPPEGWVQYSSLVAVTSADELRRRSGVAVTPQEFDRLKPHLPQVGDQEAVAKQKLEKLKDELEKISKERVVSAISSPQEFADKYLEDQSGGEAPNDDVQALRSKYNY